MTSTTPTASTSTTTPTTEQHLYTVTVSSLSPTTSKETLQAFFSFCGRIQEIELEGGQAKVHFIKESAAKTAQMLNGGVLDNSTISVTSDEVAAPKLANVKPNNQNSSTTQSNVEKHEDEIEQEDKPRSAIVAELLGHGYHLSDQVVSKAIETDSQYGISSRFLPYFNSLSSKVQQTAQPHVSRATAAVKDIDEKKGLTLKARAGFIIGSKYYTAALNSPVGAKVQAFYTTAAKQVHDVHEEALRIAEAKKSEKVVPGGTEEAPTPSTSGSSAVGYDASGKDLEKPLQSTAA